MPIDDKLILVSIRDYDTNNIRQIISEVHVNSIGEVITIDYSTTPNTLTYGEMEMSKIRPEVPIVTPVSIERTMVRCYKEPIRFNKTKIDVKGMMAGFHRRSMRKMMVTI